MPGTLEYIEAYFQQTLSEEERTAFEIRCETDELFAKDVAFYITTRNALREELLLQKQEEWKTGQEETAPVISIAKKSTLGRWIAFTAAACLILAASMYLFEAQSSPKKLVADYIKTNYTNLSLTMDASHDSLQLGLAAYNDNNYNEALRLFKGVENSDPSNSDAKKYAGLAYLQQKDYDKALQQFDELANMKGLFSNSGDFLKAVTLLERNSSGDKEAAKTLLQKVVAEKEEGSEEAEKWLRKL